LFASEVIAVKQLFEIEEPASVGCTMCSNEKFDSDDFQTPTMRSKRGWVLTGGLTANNVGTASSLLRPVAVDVSSGITGPDGIHKDLDHIRACIKPINRKSFSGV
jgi:phosphoribosylanthranilate isomerase